MTTPLGPAAGRQSALHFSIAALIGLVLAACSTPHPEQPNMLSVKDVHSFANVHLARVTTVELNLTTNFERKTLSGTAVLGFGLIDEKADVLVLDTRKLDIAKAEISENAARWAETRFELGKEDPILGSPLTIHITPSARYARITYTTSPTASGLQWLTPAQTAGKKSPFVYSQSQAIHARSWIPIQDTPSVRVTYNARIHTPHDSFAVMSALNSRGAVRSGDYAFQLGHPIPPYLIALAVGDIAFKSVERRSGVYAEPSVVDSAAQEFADMGKMLDAAEQLFGPYRWDRYDVLVLPPSFPFGGMENPRLTFATPTVLAGDKSLVSLVAHEMAHSWSGNLVTNATWSDFWLNEGYTVYIERRILEQLYGPDRAEMEAALGRQELEEEMAHLPPADQILHIDLKGRDPDDGATSIPYEKGYLFLLNLEKVFGRDNFDNYLRVYFDRYALQSITTETSVAYLKETLFGQHPELGKDFPLDEWIYKPGLPASAPRIHSKLFDAVDAASKAWIAGSNDIGASKWSTQEWLRFLRRMPTDLGVAGMQRIDSAYHLTQSGNDEILAQWLLMSVKSNYEPAYAKLTEFLETVGRRKYIKPIYEELEKTPQGRERALRIYRAARPAYHPIAQSTVDGILKLSM
jgi:leukotriene A-4 hydrolase/aminopeptidase